MKSARSARTESSCSPRRAKPRPGVYRAQSADFCHWAQLPGYSGETFIPNLSPPHSEPGDNSHVSVDSQSPDEFSQKYRKCEEILVAINAATAWQQTINDEIFRQVKFDNAVCRRISSKAKRVQRTVDDMQGVDWLTSRLADLAAQLERRAESHANRVLELEGHHASIQKAINSHYELMEYTSKMSDVFGDEATMSTNISTNHNACSGYTPELDCRTMSFSTACHKFEVIRKMKMNLTNKLDYLKAHHKTTESQLLSKEASLAGLTQLADKTVSHGQLEYRIKETESRIHFLQKRKQQAAREIHKHIEALGQFQCDWLPLLVVLVRVISQHKTSIDVTLEKSLALLTSACLSKELQFQSKSERKNGNYPRIFVSEDKAEPNISFHKTAISENRIEPKDMSSKFQPERKFLILKGKLKKTNKKPTEYRSEFKTSSQVDCSQNKRQSESLESQIYHKSKEQKYSHEYPREPPLPQLTHSHQPERNNSKTDSFSKEEDDIYVIPDPKFRHRIGSSNRELATGKNEFRSENTSKTSVTDTNKSSCDFSVNHEKQSTNDSLLEIKSSRFNYNSVGHYSERTNLKADNFSKEDDATYVLPDTNFRQENSKREIKTGKNEFRNENISKTSVTDTNKSFYEVNVNLKNQSTNDSNRDMKSGVFNFNSEDNFSERNNLKADSFSRVDDATYAVQDRNFSQCKGNAHKEITTRKNEFRNENTSKTPTSETNKSSLDVSVSPERQLTNDLLRGIKTAETNFLSAEHCKEQRGNVQQATAKSGEGTSTENIKLSCERNVFIRSPEKTKRDFLEIEQRIEEKRSSLELFTKYLDNSSPVGSPVPKPRKIIPAEVPNKNNDALCSSISSNSNQTKFHSGDGRTNQENHSRENLDTKTQDQQYLETETQRIGHLDTETQQSEHLETECQLRENFETSSCAITASSSDAPQSDTINNRIKQTGLSVTFSDQLKIDEVNLDLLKAQSFINKYAGTVVKSPEKKSLHLKSLSPLSSHTRNGYGIGSKIGNLFKTSPKLCSGFEPYKSHGTHDYFSKIDTKRFLNRHERSTTSEISSTNSLNTSNNWERSSLFSRSDFGMTNRLGGKFSTGLNKLSYLGKNFNNSEFDVSVEASSSSDLLEFTSPTTGSAHLHEEYQSETCISSAETKHLSMHASSTSEETLQGSHTSTETCPVTTPARASVSAVTQAPSVAASATVAIDSTAPTAETSSTVATSTILNKSSAKSSSTSSSTSSGSCAARRGVKVCAVRPLAEEIQQAAAPVISRYLACTQTTQGYRSDTQAVSQHNTQGSDTQWVSLRDAQGVSDRNTHGLLEKNAQELPGRDTQGFLERTKHGLTGRDDQGLTERLTRELSVRETQGQSVRNTDVLTTENTQGLTDQNMDNIAVKDINILRDRNNDVLIGSNTDELTNKNAEGLIDRNTDVYRGIHTESLIDGDTDLLTDVLTSRNTHYNGLTASNMSCASTDASAMADTRTYSSSGLNQRQMETDQQCVVDKVEQSTLGQFDRDHSAEAQSGSDIGTNIYESLRVAPSVNTESIRNQPDSALDRNELYRENRTETLVSKPLAVNARKPMSRPWGVTQTSPFAKKVVRFDEVVRCKEPD